MDTDFSNKVVYFGSGGYCGSFYIGVVEALIELFPEQVPIIHGDSIGSLVALAYSVEVPPETMMSLLNYLMSSQRKHGCRYGIRTNVTSDLEYLIDTILETGNFDLIKNNNRFNVGVTSFFNKYNVHSLWQSKEEVKEILLKSMHIPLVQNRKVSSMEMDGAYASRKNIYDVTIGTTEGYDIFTPIGCLDKMKIPTKEEQEEYRRKGYALTKDYFARKEERRSKNVPLPSSGPLVLAVMWFLKICSFLT